MGPFDIQTDNPRRQGRGCGTNVFIALIIAGIAFFTYLTRTEVNPVTGVTQRVAMTPEQEIRLGIQSAPMMARQMGGELPTSDPRVQEVQRLGRHILENSDASKGPWKFQFHVLADTDTINAFALPGGQIFITAGLYNKLTSEAQLAGVLAHEIGHVIQRHSAQQLAKQQLGQMLVLATGIGASDSRTPGGSYNAAMIAGLVNQMAQLRYSRGDEYEADQWGLKLMSQAGYDPSAMLEVMDILKESGMHGYQPEMLLTHPYPENRIEHIKEYLKENPPTSQQTKGRNLKEITY